MDLRPHAHQFKRVASAVQALSMSNTLHQDLERQAQAKAGESHTNVLKELEDWKAECMRPGLEQVDMRSVAFFVASTSWLLQTGYKVTRKPSREHVWS